MAYWCRISQSKLKHLTNQLRTHYLQISNAASLNSTHSLSKQYVTGYPFFPIHDRPASSFHITRFFAAPVQVKPKKEEKDTNGPRLNDKIMAEFVRLVEGEEHSIVPRREALERARKLKLDLVEVQKTANPPVCKIMDFHREKYKQQVKEKDRAKSKTEIRKGDNKEVRFSGKTEDKDLRMKADTVKRLMERGYRVRCSARGTEDQDLGGLLSRLCAMIEDVAVVESGPRLERTQAYVIVRHVKFGPPKKGSGKSPKVGTATTSSPSVSSACSLLKEVNAADDTATEDETLSDSDTNEVSQFGNNTIGLRSDSSKTQMNHLIEKISHRGPAFPSRQESSTVPLNRYARSEPRNQFQQNCGIDNEGNNSRRDSPGPGIPFRDKRRQPMPHTNFSPPSREAKHVPVTDLPKPKQETSQPSSSNPVRSNYGIFSSSDRNSSGK